MSKAHAIVVSDVDLFRLRLAMKASRDDVHPTAKKLLEAGLAAARVLPSARVPQDVVTMHAGVVFQDEETRLRRAVRIVYPSEADVARGLVSVLSPLGTALFGLSVGRVFKWPLPSGGDAWFRVLEVHPAR